MNKEIMIMITKGTSPRGMKPHLTSVNSCLFATNMEVMHDSESGNVNALII